MRCKDKVVFDRYHISILRYVGRELHIDIEFIGLGCLERLLTDMWWITDCSSVMVHLGFLRESAPGGLLLLVRRHACLTLVWRPWVASFLALFWQRFAEPWGSLERRSASQTTVWESSEVFQGVSLWTHDEVLAAHLLVVRNRSLDVVWRCGVWEWNTTVKYKWE